MTPEQIKQLIADALKAMTEQVTALAGEIKTIGASVTAVTTAQQAAAAKIEEIAKAKPAPTPDGKPEPKKGDKPAADDEIPAWAAAQMEALKKLGEAIAPIQEERKQTEKQRTSEALLAKVTSELKVPGAAKLKALQRLALTASDEAGLKTIVEEFVAEQKAAKVDVAQWASADPGKEGAKDQGKNATDPAQSPEAMAAKVRELAKASI